MSGFLEAAVRAGASCGCPVCRRHGEVHAQVSWTAAAGETVDVDRAMAPLLDALAAAGVVTDSSCVDLAGAVARLWPARLPELTAQGQPAVNYRRTILERLAFVRMLDTEDAAPFLSAVQWSGGEVLRASGLAQAAFPRAQILALARSA